MTTAIAERTPDTLALPKDQVDLIRRTVANGATNDELALFLYDCQRRGIHPLDKLLHFTKRGGKYTPVTSIDFMRSQAAMSGEMAGSDDPVFVNAENGRPESASVTVYRLTQGQRFAYTATARWAEYCPDNAPMWRRMPHTMLGKCAEALALRKAFPQQLAGLYSREEMDQADAPSGYVVEAPATAVPRAGVAPAADGLYPSVPNGGGSGTSSTPAPRPAIPPAVEREKPCTPSGGESSAPESGASRAPATGSRSDEGPDLGVDLPVGAYRIERVKPAAFGAKGFVVLNRPVSGCGDESTYPIYKDELKALADELCQEGVPVLVGCKQAASSKRWRIEDLMRVPRDFVDTTPPLTDDPPF